MSRLPLVSRPLAILAPLLAADDADVAARTFAALVDHVAAGRLKLDRPLLRALAAGALGPDADDAALADLMLAGPEGRAGIERLLTRGRDPGLRALAARVLDRGDAPASPELARAMLGAPAHAVLEPFLAYTRAGHRDLLALTVGGCLDPSVAPSLQSAAAAAGEPLVRRLVADLGWERINRGVEVRRLREVIVPGEPPWLVSPDEAALLEQAGARRGADHLVAVAAGASATPAARAAGRADPVDRFRRLNTVHAELLAEILDVAPLDAAKAARILASMDQVVADYTVLFADASDECRILPDLWCDLRGRVAALLAAADPAQPLSAEATRLVQMFEDPPSLGAVRTVHGLKRYLHQRGLKLGFALVDQAESPNRTVDIVVVGRGGRMLRAPTIRFAEFEAADGLGDEGRLPEPVRLVVDGWVRALASGRTALPDVNAFLFGNEVQYYIFFRNHPVFLRIDFGPPQRGGMIDLEYYGVSGYELDLHPNRDLDAIRRFFRALEFDVEQQGVRLHLRYDKERCRDFADLVAHAAALFRLAPWLMELDWLIGSLDLAGPARALLIDAWAERFRDANVLPEGALVSADRRRILLGVEAGPSGPVERCWNGQPPYADRFTGPVDPGFAPRVAAALADRGIEAGAATREAAVPSGLLALERALLQPLRDAAAAGLVRLGDPPAGGDARLVAAVHEAERFAAVLASGGKAAQAALALAAPVAEAARFVEFTPCGAVGGLGVARGVITVRGGRVLLGALRDEHGTVRMGLAVPAGGLVRRRAGARERWREEPGLGAARLWALLRGANYVGGAVRPAAVAPGELDRLRRAAAAPAPPSPAAPVGARVLGGMMAAPGRAVGRAVLGTAGRQPADVEGSVLVAREVRPSETAFIVRSAAVVCTGGAVLSHAALLAMQHGKPALLVDARWTGASERTPALRFRTVEHDEVIRSVGGLRVRLRSVRAHRADLLREGDLLVVDADSGQVRVLGSHRDTLGLWEGLRLLGEAAVRGAAAAADGETMAARALHLRARHQVGRILDRLADEAVAAFAVEEIVAGTALQALPGRERVALLVRLLDNPAVAAASGAALADVAALLAGRAARAIEAARRGLPAARHVAEVVGLRLRARRAHRLSAACTALAAGCGLAAPRPASVDALDTLARRRLGDLAAEARRGLKQERGQLPADARHRLRTLERCVRLSGLREAGLDRWRRILAEHDAAACAAAAGAFVLASEACGCAVQALVGSKAANLGEMARLAGGRPCPAWFVATDRALATMLGQPCGAASLGAAVAAVLAEPGLDVARRSARIRALWLGTPVPTAISDAVLAAYRDLCTTSGAPAAVAVRSSSCDEDTEAAMRAGEFETYLNVSGEAALLDHLRLAWAGLWSEQALDRLAREPGAAAVPHAGIIVQVMAGARVAGVVQTVNVARGDLGEVVVNAGLGLGEGLVSGVAAADLATVTVPRPGDEARALGVSYLTADKPQQVVRDERRGGTRLVDTLYHQRLRPALEYVEVCELVERCLALEHAYGYPLDIEFALEDAHLWLLQARPVGTFLGEYHETLAHHPLAAAAGGGPDPDAKDTP